MQPSAVIQAIRPCSPLAGSVIKPGWRLTAIDDNPVRDIIDYRLLTATEACVLLLEKPDGTSVRCALTKASDEDPGLIFESPTLDRVRTCANHCAFCFVDQMPAGLRRSLYVKDDDYRLSFLSGCYITLSNLDDADIQRIISVKLSPLYVSVHAYDSTVRNALLRCPISDFWQRFDRLLAGGIQLHCQIVACPGHNDGAVLVQTLSELAERRPGVASVTVVPVGLTDHRQGLPPLRAFTGAEASAVLDTVALFRCVAERADGGSWVWAADEFYLMADRLKDLPSEQDYEGYQHYENGVGMVRSLWEQWQSLLPLPPCHEQRAVRIISGVSGARALQPLLTDLRQRIAQIDVVAVPNRLFGCQVTVTGLVCATDILSALPPAEAAGCLIVVPDVMLREGSDLFLDDLSVATLQAAYAAIGAELRLVPTNAKGLINALFATDAPRRRSVRRRYL